jgi:hypothetical protein
VLALLVGGLWAGLYFFLPRYLESRVIPRFMAETGIQDFAVKVRHIGIYGTDLGALRIGPAQKPALVIQSAQIDYTPKELYRKKIERMTLSGIELYAEFKDGKFAPRSINLAEALTQLQSNRESAPESKDELPLFFPSELEIRNAVIIFKIDDRTYRIPFEISVTPAKEDDNRLNLKASMYPLGELVHAEAGMDLKRQLISLNLATTALDLSRFSGLVQTFSNFMLAGKLDLKAAAHLQLSPFKISSLDASAELQNCQIRVSNLLLQNVRGSDPKELPIKINLSKISAGDWNVSGSAVSATSPLPFTLSDWHGRIRANGKQIESTGEFNLALQPSSVFNNNLLPVEVLESLPLHGGYTAEYREGESVQFSVTSTPGKQSGDHAARFQFDQYEITAGMPAIDISGKGKLEDLPTAYAISVPKVMIASQARTIHLPQVVLKGTADLGRDGKLFSEATFKLQSPNARILLSPARINITDFTLSGQVKTNINDAIDFGGLLQFSGAGVTVPETGVKISGARGVVPLKWPPGKQMKNGDISIAALYHKQMNFGAIKGKIQQTLSGFAFEGRQINRLLPEISLKFNGDAKLLDTKDPVTNIHISLLRPDHAAEIDLGNFFPESKGVKVNGKLMLTADLAANHSGFKGAVQLQVQNASVRIQKDKFAVEGIQMSLSIPELPKLRSAAGQHLMFSKIALGDMIAKDGRIDFQIESPRSFLIEKTHFIWCDGNVDTQSMRISPGVEDYRITFYCDRLKLAKVLEQFGAATAEGEGTVNGRIPLHYKNGKIRFDDGFLFSTPGQGGKIYLKGTEILTAGIPPNTPQYVQMELAREALKDYDYSWAKLNIASEGEELLLQMQMDGKPAKILPFVYRKDIGSFVKVEAEGKGSKFQGIRLDVNFRIPLNKMLQYKGLIKMIQ